jgi:hypothetical protein
MTASLKALVMATTSSKCVAALVELVQSTAMDAKSAYPALPEGAVARSYAPILVGTTSGPDRQVRQMRKIPIGFRPPARR